jgi:glycosyltransferase involved in cell wall biosynthesis
MADIRNEHSRGARSARPAGVAEGIRPAVPIHKQVDPRWGFTVDEDESFEPQAPRLVVIVPAYNEERFIGSVVVKARRYAKSVIVVDDGSSDHTSQVASDAGAIVIRHELNQGKGAALGTGFVAAKELEPDVVVAIDGDGQHMAEEIGLVAQPVLDGAADLVIGSRYLEPTSDVPKVRILGHRVFNFITNQSSGVSVTDSQSGFRAFSPRAVETLGWAVDSEGFSVESEMQFLAERHGWRLIEVPIIIQYHDKPKRNVLAHGLLVLNGMLGLIGQHRPLLFFSIPGFVLLLLGVATGLNVVQIYQSTTMLAVGYAILTQVFVTLGVAMLCTGLMLHSVRGLLLYLVGSNRYGGRPRQP